MSFSYCLSFILFQSVLPYGCHHIAFGRCCQTHREFLPMACRQTSLLAECRMPCFCTTHQNRVRTCLLFWMVNCLMLGTTTSGGSYRNSVTQFPTRSRYVHEFQFGKATLTLSLQIAMAVAHMCYCRLVTLNANHSHHWAHCYITEVIGFQFDGIISLLAHQATFVSQYIVSV